MESGFSDGLIELSPLPRAAQWRSVPGLWDELSDRRDTVLVLVLADRIILEPTTDRVALMRLEAFRVRNQLPVHREPVFLGAHVADGSFPSDSLPSGRDIEPKRAADFPVTARAYFGLFLFENDDQVITALVDAGAPGFRDARSLRANDSHPEEVTGRDTIGGIRWRSASVRAVGDDLDPRDREITMTALALARWYDATRFCSRCAGVLKPTSAGWVLHCDQCLRDHYPRTDPAMIVSVLDAHDRLLLAHNKAWPQGRASLLAGFVEPGETLEQSVRREVAEEVGVHLAGIEYLGSQPWPFPASLMVAFRARAASAEIIVDEDEITWARWFSRDELREQVAAGRLLLPASFSIARAVIENWLAQG